NDIYALFKCSKSSSTSKAPATVGRERMLGGLVVFGRTRDIVRARDTAALIRSTSRCAHARVYPGFGSRSSCERSRVAFARRTHRRAFEVSFLWCHSRLR